jgi:four helix bundle protein
MEVYQKAKSFNKITYNFILQQKELDRTTKDQLRRASFSIMLNIAEGSSRFSNRIKEISLLLLEDLLLNALLFSIF